MPPKISEGQDEAHVQVGLEALRSNGWLLKEERSLEKTYNFKTYTKVMDMHHSVGIRSKSENHHATMTSTFGSLTVEWTTHQPPGLSDKDIRMAEYCDEQAEHIGIVEPSEAVRCGSASPTS